MLMYNLFKEFRSLPSKVHQIRNVDHLLIFPKVQPIKGARTSLNLNMSPYFRR